MIRISNVVKSGPGLVAGERLKMIFDGSSGVCCWDLHEY